MKKSVSLQSNRLEGSLPSQFGMLTGLSENFELFSNQLCGDIPSEVSILSDSVSLGYSIVTANSLGTWCPTSKPTSGPTTPLPSSSPSVSPFPSPLPSILPTSHDQIEDLKYLYNATSGPSWISNSGWMSGAPCDVSWYGLDCENGFVNRMVLDANNLTGSVPSQIGELTRL
eukprot:CAMPEP_0185756644 /NCGR_PEP_ID=MMETSP1174-20130828/15070_1 /TAXON_ID=35687 /ORGANISM="Dictyocha speculum, Strain CCMP1381" /LENGTH=171 /DNA_ID=CAMNT_0028435701 /DNA_START=757 /DNA_END=1268 /DNA_ORIENTATION=+